MMSVTLCANTEDTFNETPDISILQKELVLRFLLLLLLL